MGRTPIQVQSLRREEKAGELQRKSHPEMEEKTMINQSTKRRKR